MSESYDQNISKADGDAAKILLQLLGDKSIQHEVEVRQHEAYQHESDAQLAVHNMRCTGQMKREYQNGIPALVRENQTSTNLEDHRLPLNSSMQRMMSTMHSSILNCKMEMSLPRAAAQHQSRRRMRARCGTGQIARRKARHRGAQLPEISRYPAYAVRRTRRAGLA